MSVILKRRVTAKVKLTVEVTVPDKWGEDCSMKQVYDQAKTEAVGALRKLFQQAGERGLGFFVRDDACEVQSMIIDQDGIKS